MNAVISLCHFCEIHGPSVLFVTQAFHEPDNPILKPRVHERKACYGKATEKLGMREPAALPCEACESFNYKNKAFLCNDHEGQISYLSTQQPTEEGLATLVRQACTRSLSCEVTPGKEAPIYFGDEVRGHVLSYTFFLKDAQARGFQRWFSIIVLMRDKYFLLNSWPFLVEHIEKIISEVQEKALKIYDKEQAECPQRAMRLSAAHSGDGKRLSNKPSRSVGELTGDKEIFSWLHLQFTWLLKAGAERLVEKFPGGFHGSDTTSDAYSYQETEEGFTLLNPEEVPSPAQDLEASASNETHETSQSGPKIDSLRHLHQILGPTQFLSLAYCLIVGRKIILRGSPPELITSIANCLKMLVPRSCYQAVLNSDKYLGDFVCNILGVKPRVAVPQPSPKILRLDILPPSDKADSASVEKYTYKITWGGQLPNKCPTVLLKMIKAIENTNMKESVLHYHFVALKEEWLDIAKTARMIRHWQPGSVETCEAMLKSMGATEHEDELLQFWLGIRPFKFN